MIDGARARPARKSSSETRPYSARTFAVLRAVLLGVAVRQHRQIRIREHVARRGGPVAGSCWTVERATSRAHLATSAAGNLQGAQTRPPAG